MSESEVPSAAAPPRRGFFARVAAWVVGGFCAIVPGAVGLVTALNPLRLRAESGRLVRLTTLAALPEDGTPRKFDVIVDRSDAWNYFPDEPIGAVFLRRTGDAARPVEALQVICPHAGCIIQYEAAGGGRFFCPCHAASFDLSGKRLEQPSHSPRDMDTLEVDPQRLAADGEVWVRFENYKTGTSQKVVQS